MKPKVKPAANRDHRAEGATHETRITPYGRTCNCCGVYKRWEFFYPSKQSYTGHMGTCKPCHNAKYREARNKKKVSKRSSKQNHKIEDSVINNFLLGKQ